MMSRSTRFVTGVMYSCVDFCEVLFLDAFLHLHDACLPHFVRRFHRQPITRRYSERPSKTTARPSSQTTPSDPQRSACTVAGKHPHFSIEASPRFVRVQSLFTLVALCRPGSQAPPPLSRCLNRSQNCRRNQSTQQSPPDCEYTAFLPSEENLRSLPHLPGVNFEPQFSSMSF